MFTSSIKSKSFFNGEFKVEVEFTNGTQTWTETITVRSENGLNASVRQRLQELNDLTTYNAQLALGAFTPTPIVTTTPTVAEQESITWFRNFNRLEKLTKLNTLGALRPALVVDLDELKATVAADFKKAYIADM